MTTEERNELIKSDERYKKIICRCESVTEGEIVDAINRPCGARTVDGVKEELDQEWEYAKVVSVDQE